MSHQTGIQADDELKAVFAKCKSEREIRLLKLSIVKEKLVCNETRQMSISRERSDWKQDWQLYMKESFLPKSSPCYILFRLGSKNDAHETISVISPSKSPTTTTTSAAAPKNTTNQAAPTPPVKPAGLGASIVSKLTGPPKLASILTNSLNNSNNSGNSAKSNAGANNASTETITTTTSNNTASSSSALPDEAARDQWLFVSWTPETSLVREKMIYASTKSTVKQAFGGGSIFADYFVASADELSLDAVTKWIERKQHIRDGHIDVNELSLSEQELQQVKLDEAALCADLQASALNSKTKSLPSIEMPIDDKAISAFYDFKQGKTAYVQLSIDPKSEIILMERNEPANGFDLAKKSIASMMPRDHPRYHLVSFNHQHNKKQTKATLFIYSLPTSGCSIKEKMLYSSVKNSLLQVLQEESKIGIVIDRRIETDDPSELTEKFFYEELHPVEAVQTSPQAFIKPKGPSKQAASSRRRVM